MKENANLLSDYLSKRTGLIEFILIGIFIAFSINLITEGLITLLQLPAMYSFSLGVLICIGVFIYFINNFLRLGEKNVKFDGVILYHSKQNKLMPINRYEFSEEISRYLKAAFKENEAFKKLWDKEPLSNILSEMGILKKLESKKIIREAVEYYFLEKLSIHLTDYFHKEPEKNETVTFTRPDIPQILFSNRFLELFSKPMTERPLFVDSAKESKDDSIDVVMVLNDDAIYSRFDLTLPKGSIITRTDNLLILETDRFIMSIDINFDGYSSSLPIDFERLYLKIKNRDDISAFLVDLSINVKFKFISHLSNKGWEYYNWIDSFLDEMSISFSKDEFLTSICWEQTATIMKCLKNMKKD